MWAGRSSSLYLGLFFALLVKALSSLASLTVFQSLIQSVLINEMFGGIYTASLNLSFSPGSLIQVDTRMRLLGCTIPGVLFTLYSKMELKIVGCLY